MRHPSSLPFECSMHFLRSCWPPPRLPASLRRDRGPEGTAPGLDLVSDAMQAAM
jgi:hypothetical protein